MSSESLSCSAFDGTRLIAKGAPVDVALAVRWAMDAGATGPVLVFDDLSSQPLDFDLRGTEADIRARLEDESASQGRRGRGRPKLGVTSREVTLLPRHWQWLAEQRGGASAALRRLVEQSMRSDEPQQQRRQAEEAVDRFMNAMTGDLPGHEEASRAFWRRDQKKFASLIADWPVNVRDHLRSLALRALEAENSNA